MASEKTDMGGQPVVEEGKLQFIEQKSDKLLMNNE